MPGGVPFSLLVGLYEVRHKPSRGRSTDDVSALQGAQHGVRGGLRAAW